MKVMELIDIDLDQHGGLTQLIRMLISLEQLLLMCMVSDLIVPTNSVTYIRMQCDAENVRIRFTVHVSVQNAHSNLTQLFRSTIINDLKVEILDIKRINNNMKAVEADTNNPLSLAGDISEI